MRIGRLSCGLALAAFAIPALTAQHLQFAATFGGLCVDSACTGSYLWRPDTATAVALDSSGNIYVAGTSFGEFPLVNAIEPEPYPAGALNGWSIPFVAKIDPTGAKLLYATPIGGPNGSGSLLPVGLAVDSAGNAYVTGASSADGFPGLSGTSSGGAFLVKLDASGKLLLSKRFGGMPGDDAGSGIALDGSGNVYIAGATGSADFPVTKGAYLSSLTAARDVFLTKMDGSTGEILYSTFLGPGDVPQLALGPSGDVLVAANTTSANWPVTTGAVQPHCGGTECADVILLRFHLHVPGDLSGSRIVYATYLGGSGSETLGGIASDKLGSLYLSGTTNSSDFPVTGSATAPVPCPAADGATCGTKAFAARLNPEGTALDYSTYLGGSALDYGQGIAIDGAGNAYVTGKTTSANFPAVNAFQPAIIPGVCATPHGSQAQFCGGAGFLTVLNPAGNAVLWSTLLGRYSNAIFNALGYGFTGAFGVAVDAASNVYVAGSDLAIAGKALNAPAAFAVPSGGGEATVLKISPGGQHITLAPNAIVNAASYAPGLPFAGALASVFVNGLTGIDGTFEATGNPLPAELQGVSVKVDGEPAPILAVASLPEGGQQINFQMPLDRGLGETADGGVHAYPALEIDANGKATFTGALPVAPGIFTFANGSPAVLHAADFAAATTANPVVPGETLAIFLTGLGPYTPGQTGVPAGAAVPLPASLTPSVSLGGTSCTVLYAGPAPGYVGLDQINCQTSTQLPSNIQPLQVISPMTIFESPGTPAFVTNSQIVHVLVR